MQIQTNKYIQQGFWLCLGLAFFGYLSIHKIQFDTDLLRMFPSGDPDVKFYGEFKERFHSAVDDEVLLIALKNPSGLFQNDFLKKTDSLTKLLLGIHRVTKVYSLTNSGYLFIKDNQLEARPLIHIGQPQFYAEDSTLLFQSAEFRNLLISKSGKAIAIAAFHATDMNFKQKQRILDTVQSCLHQLGFNTSHITGKIKFETGLIQLYGRDTIYYLVGSIIFICAFFLIRFASIKAAIAVILVSSIHWGICLAVYSVSGIPLSIFGVALGILAWCLNLGMLAFVLEQIIRYPIKDANREHETIGYFFDFIKKRFLSFLILLLPVMLLGFTAVPALREITAIGVVILILSNLGTLLAVCYLLPFYSSTKIKKVNASTPVFFLVFIFITTLFISKTIPGETFQGNIAMNSVLYQDYQFLENDFYGTRRFEMLLQCNDTLQTFLDLEKLKMAESIEKYLADSLSVAHIISPVSLFKAANKAFYGGHPANYILPLNQEDLYNYAVNIRQTQYADDMERYFSDGKMIRVSGRLRDMNKGEFANLIRRFDEFFKSNAQYKDIQYRITGLNYISDKYINHYKTWMPIGIMLFLLAGLYLSLSTAKKRIPDTHFMRS